jgi:hypothetical protein
VSSTVSGRRNILQSVPLCLDAKYGLDQSASDHESRTDEIAERDLGDVP